MRGKSVGHRHLVAPRQRFDQGPDARPTWLPGICRMSSVSLLASVGVDWVNLAELLRHTSYRRVTVVNHNWRNGITSLVRCSLSVGFLISQKQTFSCTMALVGRRLRGLVGRFNRAFEWLTSHSRLVCFGRGRRGAANKALIVGFGLSNAGRQRYDL